MIDLVELEKEATTLVGILVIQWAKIDELVWSNISNLQMRLRHRRLHRDYAEPHSLDVRPSLSDYHPHAGDNVRHRLRHAKRLIGALSNDPDMSKQGCALFDKASALYAIRNDFAHGALSIDLDGKLQLVSREWAKKAERERGDDRQKKRFKPCSKGMLNWLRDNWEILNGCKVYEIVALREAAEAVTELHCSIRAFIGALPLEGVNEDPVKLSASRGSRPRLTK